MDAHKRLLELPIFAGVPEADLDRVLRVARLQVVDENGLLMEVGEEGNDIAVVLQGSFTVEIGQGSAVLPLAWVAVGEVLGETALFRRSSVRTARVRAAEPSVVLRMDSEVLENLVLEGNQVPRAIEEAVMRALARRIHDSVEAIDGVLSAHLEPPARGGPLARLRELFRR